MAIHPDDSQHALAAESFHLHAASEHLCSSADTRGVAPNPETAPDRVYLVVQFLSDRNLPPSGESVRKAREIVDLRIFVSREAMVRGLQFYGAVLFRRRLPETPEQARQRRFCRFMLGLPPETVYHHVREGVATVVALCVVLVAVVAWQLGHLAALAPALLSGAALAVLTPTVLAAHRRYRHAVAGVLVLTAMLVLLAAAVHRSGYAATVGFVVGPPLSTIADAASPR